MSNQPFDLGTFLAGGQPTPASPTPVNHLDLGTFLGTAPQGHSQAVGLPAENANSPILPLSAEENAIAQRQGERYAKLDKWLNRWRYDDSTIIYPAFESDENQVTFRI